MTEVSKPVRGTPAKGFTTGQLNITSAPTLIIAAREHRRNLLVINHGTFDVFLGDSGVSTVTGLLLSGAKGTGIIIPVDIDLYGIVASGSQTVSFMELFGI